MFVSVCYESPAIFLTFFLVMDAENTFRILVATDNHLGYK